MKTQKQRIFSILAILTMAVILTCIFAACDKVGEKQVPVYKGMTISRNFAMASATTASDDVGNTYSQGEQGRVEGDYDKRDDDFDQNKPFEDPNAPSIENKANSTLDVVGAAESIYYADKNQDIFITIKLSNPDSYEILSFTLNGKKYSNYMFENGSDMENLVLKVNVGDVGGIVEYTIDAIKYVDGTEIKDVRMDGDRTVKAGVRASDQTYANVTNEQKSMTSISFDAQVVDLYSLIEKSGGYAKAVLYDGVNMLTKDIKVGEKTSIVFDNLTPNTVYQYGVVALYDNLSGNGAKLNTLYKKAVYTDTIVLFKDVQVGKESMDWGFVWNESFANKQMGAISLWQNGAKVQDVDTTATRIDGLKSNNEYTLKATYKNSQNQDESILITFTTLTKVIPSVEIGNWANAQNKLSVDVTYTDVDGVGQIESIALFKGETKVATTSERTHVVFDALESDTEYTLVVAYKYDLNDGKGEQTATQKAKRYTTPQFEFVEATCANTSAVSKGEIIYFEAKVANPSGVAIERIKINDKYYTPSSGTTKTSIIVNITVEDQFEGGNTALEVTEIEGTLRGQKVSLVLSENNVATVFVNGELIVKSSVIVDAEGKECDMAVEGNQYYYIVSFENKTGYTIDGINSFTLANGDYTMIDAETAKIPVSFSAGSISCDVTSIAYSNSSLGNKTKDVFGVTTSAVCVKSETPVVITSAEQLKNMNDWQYYVLGNDIDLAGTEWKDPADFRGFFDGQGYAIKNMNFVGTVENTSFYWGLFHEAEGLIKNIKLNGRLIATINNPEVNNYGACIGGLCVIAKSLTIDTVENNVKLSVTSNGTSACVGGFVGSFTGGIYDKGVRMIINSCNTGDVTASSNSSSDDIGDTYAGGLVGYLYTSENMESLIITDSYNTGNVTASASTSRWTSAGGMVGYCYLYESTRSLVITNSYNAGNVTASANRMSFAGGMVGYFDRIYSTGSLVITNSYNAGNVTATGSETRGGGLVGFGWSSVINSCYNSGLVKATSINSSDAYVGGLVGSLETRDSSCVITDSYNVGIVQAVSDNSYYIREGGLVGKNYGSSLTITNSYYSNSNGNYGGEKKTADEIVEIVKNKWDSSVWDFDNLDENGNPTLKI